MVRAASPSSYRSAEEALGAFRAAMRRLAGHVHVVTTRLGDERAGLTATAVCSLTAQPPRVLACINLSGRSFQMIAESRVMAVNVLGAEHQALARRFAGAGGTDPFEGPERWTQAGTGAPLLADAQASFDCVVDQLLVTSTHAIVIGDIRHISHRDSGEPLLYADGQFISTTPLAIERPAS
jgi:flavin reductase (NADH)